MLVFYQKCAGKQVRTILCNTTLFDTVLGGICLTCNDLCPVRATLDMIGGKYKALILWHLAQGQLRFSQLSRSIPFATPKMLTQQLRELEEQDLIHREVFPVVPPKVEYSLTETGKSLLPILVAMRDWGADYLRKKEEEPTCFMMNSTPCPSCCK